MWCSGAGVASYVAMKASLPIPVPVRINMPRTLGCRDGWRGYFMKIAVLPDNPINCMNPWRTIP